MMLKKTQLILKTIIFIIFVSTYSIASACHEGDFESVYKGHHKWGKSVGLFQFTENSTISISTTSSCDIYTAFLDSEFNFIQEQIALGGGPHIDALGMISGCKKIVRFEFSKTLRLNYANLFSKQLKARELKSGIRKIIESNSLLKESCNNA